jgi:HEAT repeat protein
MRKRSRKAEAEDINQIATRMVQHVIEATEEPDLTDKDARSAAARALGRLGGLKGGPARAAKMTTAERSESASKAAHARWNKKTGEA